MKPLFQVLRQCAGDIEECLAVERCDYGKLGTRHHDLLHDLIERLKETSQRTEFQKLVYDKMTNPPGVLTNRQAIAAVVNERPDLKPVSEGIESEDER